MLAVTVRTIDLEGIEMHPIHTLNARSHIMLEVYRDHFGIAAPAMRKEIQRLHRDMIAILQKKGIEYSTLKSALVPSADKLEAAFVFDSTAIKSASYGREVLKTVLPSLDPRTTQSILVGDMLCDDQQLAFDVLKESLTLARSFEFKHSTLLFVVYINNLSKAALKQLHADFSNSAAYVGFIDALFSSRAKTIFSLCLSNLLVKKGRKLIVAHEDDRANDDNINITFYPLEEFGYQVISLQSYYFGVFLSYKIERPVAGAFAVDSEIGLNAISDEVIDLDGLRVLLEDAKHAYLLEKKIGSLEQAGIAGLDREGIASVIQSKVMASYIYNHVYLKDHDVMKFNLMIEIERDRGHPTRLTVAMEYLPTERMLRVITLF